MVAIRQVYQNLYCCKENWQNLSNKGRGNDSGNSINNNKKDSIFSKGCKVCCFQTITEI